MNTSGQSVQGEEGKIVYLPASLCGSKMSSHLDVTFTWALNRSAVSRTLVGTGCSQDCREEVYRAQEMQCCQGGLM